MIKNIYIALIILITIIIVAFIFYNTKIKKVDTYDNIPKKKIVLYYTEWCGYCKKFKPVWEQLEKSTTFTTLKIDCDKYQNIAANEGIKGFPTLILYFGNNKKIYTGDLEYSKIIEFINYTN